MELDRELQSVERSFYLYHWWEIYTSSTALVLDRPRYWLTSPRSHFTFKQRNFDPETRQNRRREAGEDGEDTVEKAVEGLAEQIIQEDEAKRAEELVSLGV